MTTATMATGTRTTRTAAESELRAAARRRGLTMKELAALMGVSAGYLSQIANGGRPWTPKMREKIAAVLGEVPGQGAVYRQGGVVTGESQGVVVAGESSYIRERARELGMSLRDLADRVGVSYSYMSMVAGGHSNMGVKVQARMESALEAPAKVAPAQPACIDREAVWERMNAHGFSQNEAARRAGISSANLSQIMNGRNNPSPVVLKKLHGVLFQPTKAERVMPAEVKVLGWRKGERSGMVVHGAGGPGRRGRSGGPAIRVGGRVPWGAKAEFAYRAGYDGTGRLSVTHVVERGYSPGSPCMPPFFVARNQRPSSTSPKQGQRALTSARRRYRAACPSPPCVPSASRANPLAARAAPLPGSMPMMASKSSTALSNRAAYMRAIPRL